MINKRPFILLVDDDSDDHLFFKSVLSKIKIELDCLTAINGKEAIEQLENFDILPLYIFMDINMPIMNGFECLQEIKSNHKLAEIPVIMYSTSDDIKAKETAKFLGAECFLTKPTDLKILEKNLKQILSQNSMITANS